MVSQEANIAIVQQIGYAGTVNANRVRSINDERATFPVLFRLHNYASRAVGWTGRARDV